jgi:putative endonuclease
MFTVYILYSISWGKSYVGYTNNVARRLQEHNITESKGFTLRYRPWTLIHTEVFDTKAEAMQKEKFYKSGVGRNEVKVIIEKYLLRYPPVAEMD